MPEGIITASGARSVQNDRDLSNPVGAPAFEWPEEVPWSEIGPEFIETWAPRPAEGGKLEGEHLEVTGQSGSGKSYVLATVHQMRALRRDSAMVYVCTKADDSTVARLVALGWPLAKSWDEVRRHRQSVFWPQTKLIGGDKDRYFEGRIYDLLTRLWVPESNTVVTFDEIGYVEGLQGPRGDGARLKHLIRQYWREGRALGISVVASKQRPIGVVRDQHSESRWKIVFAPADMGDMERFAELLGRPKDWQPVLEQLDQERHQFVIRNNVLKAAYISWVDFPLESLRKLQPRQKTTSETLYGRERRAS